MDVDLKLAARIRGIDVILGGHTHDGVPAPVVVGRTLVTNAGSNGKFLAVLDLQISGAGIVDHRYRLLPVFANLLPEDPAMSAYVAKVRAPYRDKLGEKLARGATRLPAGRRSRRARAASPCGMSLRDICARRRRSARSGRSCLAWSASGETPASRTRHDACKNRIGSLRRLDPRARVARACCERPGEGIGGRTIPAAAMVQAELQAIPEHLRLQRGEASC